MAEAYDVPTYLVDLRTEPLAIVTVVVVVIALLSIILRAWAQWGTERAWSGILVTAMIVLMADAGLNLAVLRYGLGAPDGTPLGFKQVVLLTQLLFAICIAYALVLGVAKLTILQMYLKIFEVHNTRIWIMVLAAVSIAACLANVFVVIFQCKPVQRSWLGATSGTCINLQNAFLGFAIVNITLDVLIPMVPAFGVAKLRADVGRKTLAVVMLLLGSTTIIASAYRLSQLVKPAPLALPNRLGARLTTWSTIEGAAAVTSSCLPLLKPLGRSLVAKFRTFRRNSSEAWLNSSSTVVDGAQEKHVSKSVAVSNMDSTSSADSITQEGSRRRIST